MIRFFAAHPTAANLLMVLLIMVGAVALPTLRRETFPDFAATALQVRAVYPGASAETVEESVVGRIEDAVDGVAGVVEIRSEAREGVALVTIEMDPDADIATFQADIQSEVSGISDFPEDVEDPIIDRLGNESAVVSIAVTGPMTPPDLKAYCEQLRRELRQYEEISLVEVDGFSDRQIQIRIKAAAADQYGLSISDLADVVASQSLDLPAGSIETRDGEVLVRFSEERRSIAEYEDLIVLGGSVGGEVRLGDIGEIEDTFELDEDKVLFNGRRAGMLRVTKTKAEDSLVIMDAVRDFVDRTEQTKPPGVELALTEDVSSIVADRLRLLLVNGYQGLILVFLTLWLFFTPRLAFWVAAGLPVSFLGALFVMGQIDYSLNMMTMLALLLALGLLMDDAIVLAENVAAHQRRGKSGLRAAIEGVNEVRVGVLSSFTTTLCVFLPLVALDGDIGKVLLVIPVVLILVLSVSLIEAFLILPNHLGHALDHEDRDNPGRFRAWFDAKFETVRQRYLGTAVDTCVRYRYATVGATVSAFIVSMGMLSGGILKFQAFPDIDGDVVQLSLLLPQGTPLHETEKVVEEAVEALDAVEARFGPEQPDGESLIRNVSVRFNQNSDAGESGPHVATISVDLLGAEVRSTSIDEVTAVWRREIGPVSDVVSAKFGAPTFGPAGRPIELRVRGADLGQLQEASNRIEAFFRDFEGVFDVAGDLRPGKPEVRVRLRPGAVAADVRGSTVAQQLQAAFSGKTAQEIQVGSEGYEVALQLDQTDTDTLADLEYFRINLGPGVQVPLGAIARLDADRGFAKINRVDGERTVTITGDLDPDVANTTELIRAFEEELLPQLGEDYPALRISVEGESSSTAETLGSMVRGLLIGLFGVFVLLSFQFRSYVEPSIVMVAVPFSLIGVVWGNLGMGDPMTMPGMLGFISLAGVVVNDSILLVEFIKIERRRGLDSLSAARLASRERFRAVLLTSTTTVAGLVPLLFERSPQAQILIPVASSIVFGIIASTVLVLLVIPAMYAILADFGLDATVTDDADLLEEEAASGAAAASE